MISTRTKPTLQSPDPMITFSSNDYALDEIKVASRLGNMLTKHRYNVYGLAGGKDVPAVGIRLGTAVPQASLDQLTTLFAQSGIDLGFVRAKKPKSKHKVYLGLRRDIREHVNQCAAIVQTVIYHLEGRLDIGDGSYVIPGIPKTRKAAKH